MVTHLFSALLALPIAAAWASSPGGHTQHHAQASDWPAANRTVDEAGGWKAYLRESAAAQSAAPPEARSSAFRGERSAAQRATEVRRFAQTVDGWIDSALLAQPGLSKATQMLSRELAAARHLGQLSPSARSTLSHAVGLARQVTDDAITWAYAQEHRARRREREDLAEVQWELAHRMHAVGNVPLVEERKARLHLLEARADLYKAQARMLAARESLVRHLRPAGLWSEPADGADGLVLPLPQSATPAGLDAAAASEDRTAVNRFARLLPAAQRGAVIQRARSASEATPYALRHVYAALVQAEDQLQLATVRAQLLVDEGLAVRSVISDEHLLAYNGMLIGTPKLLKDRDGAMAFELEVLEAVRDYWLARSRRDHQQVVVLLEETFWGVSP
nr:hypothetical protein NCPCFENI_00252 [Cupriavidus sp.]